MEIIYMIVGLVMFYAWTHSVVICVKKLKDVTVYEKVVLWVGFIVFVLYVIGTLS